MKNTIKVAILVLLASLAGCRTTVSPETQLRHRLQSIIIPQVDFNEADITDVVSYLKSASMLNDPSGRHGKGIAIIIDSKRLAAGLEKAKPITFHAKNISLFDLIEAVTKIAGLEYSIGPSVIIDRKTRVQSGGE